MGELLIRRRELLLPSSAPSEWDYEWHFTDGLPSNDGWTKSGADTPTMTAAGLETARTYYTRELPITKGVIEAKFAIKNTRTSMNRNRALLRIGNSSKAVYVVFTRYNSNLIVLYDDSNLQSSNPTQIGTFTWGGEYTVRLSINGAVGSVEINGVTVKDDVDTSSIYAKGALLFGNNQQYGVSVWQYVKYKSLD